MTRRSIGLLALGLLALAVAGVYGVGWQLSRPVPADVGSAPVALQAEPVAFRSESGSTIHGWFSRGVPHGGAVLLLPGIRANRRSMLGRAELLHAAGYSTLAIDFQATGESPGDIITFGWRERLDVLAAVAMLSQRLPEESIGIIGTSLGGAATVFAAPALDVQAVVLEAVYPSIDVAVENRLRMRLGRLGAAVTPLLLLQLRPRLGVSSSDLKPIDHIAGLAAPILIIGGIDDHHTTVADTQRLYEAASQPKELWLIPNAAHVDYLNAGAEDYRRRVLAFFGRTLRIVRPAQKPQQAESAARAELMAMPARTRCCISTMPATTTAHPRIPSRTSRLGSA